MAETKPPLFHMHGMSALFHIPQQAPPTLKETGTMWSQDFRDFLSHCLCKAPEERWTATKLLTHPFVDAVGELEGRAVLAALIQRSKDVVKGEIDTSPLEESGILESVIHEDGELPETPEPGAEEEEPESIDGVLDVPAAGSAEAGGAASASKATSDTARKIARRKQELPMSRHPKNYNTIKLPSSRLRQQRESIAVSATVMNEQMSALRKFQTKRADAMKQLAKAQQQEMDAVLKKQAEEALDLKRRHEVAWGTATRDHQHDDDRLLRTQAAVRKRMEEVRAVHAEGDLD